MTHRKDKKFNTIFNMDDDGMVMMMMGIIIIILPVLLCVCMHACLPVCSLNNTFIVAYGGWGGKRYG
jgi:hypothetical protein